MQRINVRIANKLSNLSSFLNEACKEFEDASKSVTEKDITMSVRSLIVETKQYIEELNSQVVSLSAKNISYKINDKEEVKSDPLANKYLPARNMIEQCCNAEVFFERAYRLILNEQFPYTALRQMLTYQLNGIKCAFMQLKLLKSVMSTETTLGKELF
jgi:hypothetical protein